jgi:argininosuccinate lyase
MTARSGSDSPVSAELLRSVKRLDGLWDEVNRSPLGVEPDPGRMRDFLARTETTMTALADHLVARHGLSFRSAHEAVGQLLRRLPPDDGSQRSVPAIRLALQEIVAEAAGRALVLDESEIARALDPAAAVHAAAFGGGPAPEVVRGQLHRLRERLGGLAGNAGGRQRRLAEADLRLQQAIDGLAGDGGSRDSPEAAP